MDDSKPETSAGSHGLGGEEGFENAVGKLEARAVILEAHDHEIVVRPGTDVQRTVTTWLHGIECIVGEVEEDLLETLRLGIDAGFGIFIEVYTETGLLEGVGAQPDDDIESVMEAYATETGMILSGVLQKIADQCARADGLLEQRLHESGADFRAIRDGRFGSVEMFVESSA